MSLKHISGLCLCPTYFGHFQATHLFNESSALCTFSVVLLNYIIIIFGVIGCLWPIPYTYIHSPSHPYLRLCLFPKFHVIILSRFHGRVLPMDLYSLVPTLPHIIYCFPFWAYFYPEDGGNRLLQTVDTARICFLKGICPQSEIL
jgi:hypothetical protein